MEQTSKDRLMGAVNTVIQKEAQPEIDRQQAVAATSENAEVSSSLTTGVRDGMRALLGKTAAPQEEGAALIDACAVLQKTSGKAAEPTNRDLLSGLFAKLRGTPA